MRIAYEGLVYQMMPRGGIARYFREIIHRIPSESEPCVLLPESMDLPKLHPNLSVTHTKTTFPFARRSLDKLAGRHWRRWQWPKIQRQLESFKADIHHWTYHCGICYRPMVQSGVPNVVTVCDFIYEHHPELDARGKHRDWQRRSIEMADLLLCISETTFHELCDRYPHKAQMARMTPLGNSFSSISTGALPKVLHDQPFLLFVGRRAGYKNFKVLWDAWLKARQKNPDLLLVAVGPEATTQEFNAMGISFPERGFHTLGQVSDETLKTLYQHSTAFVFPSKMEGFGLPVVEAMESGTLLLNSDCDALKEVGGESAAYFQHDDVNTLAELIQTALTMPSTERQHRIEAGKKRAKLFSWDQTAKLTVDAYRQLLQD